MFYTFIKMDLFGYASEAKKSLKIVSKRKKRRKRFIWKAINVLLLVYKCCEMLNHNENSLSDLFDSEKKNKYYDRIMVYLNVIRMENG